MAILNYFHDRLFPLQSFAAGQHPNFVRTAKEDIWRKFWVQFQPFHSNLFCLPLASSSLLTHTAENVFWTSLSNSRDSSCEELVHWMLARLTALVAKGYPNMFSLCRGISEFTVFPLLEALSADKSLVSYPALFPASFPDSPDTLTSMMDEFSCRISVL